MVQLAERTHGSGRRRSFLLAALLMLLLLGAWLLRTQAAAERLSEPASLGPLQQGSAQHFGGGLPFAHITTLPPRAADQPDLAALVAPQAVLLYQAPRLDARRHLPELTSLTYAGVPYRRPDLPGTGGGGIPLGGGVVALTTQFGDPGVVTPGTDTLVSPVPLPAALALFGAALGALAVAGRRR